MTNTIIAKARQRRAVAVDNAEARKNGQEPKTIVFETAKARNRFQPVDDLVAKFDYADKFAAAG